MKYTACETLTTGQTAHQILTRTIALLSDNRRWCKYAAAINSARQRVSSGSPDAAAFSVLGAVGRVSNEWGIVPIPLMELLDSLVLEALGIEGSPSIWEEHDIDWYNDNYDHESVMELLREAQRRTACSGM